MNCVNIEDISFVVQGPIISDFTKKVCESIRALAPNAEIVLSTWEGSALEDLEYDIVVENKDPGCFKLILPEVMDNGSDEYVMNVNRQIISTINGLKRATKKYACKLRSDLQLKNLSFIEYYKKYDAPIKYPYNKYINHRVVTLPAANPERCIPCPFYLCDWFFFGLREDLINIWDIPLVSEKSLKGDRVNGIPYIVNNFSNES